MPRISVSMSVPKIKFDIMSNFMSSVTSLPSDKIHFVEKNPVNVFNLFNHNSAWDYQVESHKKCVGVTLNEFLKLESKSAIPRILNEIILHLSGFEMIKYYKN